MVFVLLPFLVLENMYLPEGMWHLSALNISLLTDYSYAINFE